MGKKVDIKGQVFGKLTVLGDFGYRTMSGSIKWRCRCECGNITYAIAARLKKGRRVSCGCSRAETARKNAKHGHNTGKWSPTYCSWVAMAQRCTNENHESYYLYGARGIKICDRWKDFRNFLEDMGERPKGKTIDRISSDGHYEPRNCRWATPIQQGRSNRRNVMNEEIASLIKGMYKQGWGAKKQSELTGLSYSAIQNTYLNKRWEEITPDMKATEEKLLDALERFRNPPD